jgi:hypothetical protein
MIRRLAPDPVELKNTNGSTIAGVKDISNLWNGAYRYTIFSPSRMSDPPGLPILPTIDSSFLNMTPKSSGVSSMLWR